MIHAFCYCIVLQYRAATQQILDMFPVGSLSTFYEVHASLERYLIHSIITFFCPSGYE